MRSFYLKPRSPDFIGIGAQKAGTTWLHCQLKQHPEIWLPETKELHYFNSANSSQSLDWYQSHFASAPPHCLTGEVTPAYAICNQHQIANMHAVCPRAKLLFQLRNPVDRFWSQCLMKQAAGVLSVDDHAATVEFFNSGLSRPRGDYLQTIENFCRLYQPSQILLLFFDAIAISPQQLLSDVFSFLELPDHLLPTAQLNLSIRPAATSTPMPEELRRHIAESYQQEMMILSDLFASHASHWLGNLPRESGSRTPLTIHLPATVQLRQDHVDQILERTSARAIEQFT
ncbi:MAG: sulfotransferase domain-containing protein [Planctomycetia bacterium]|nr:sulfotransferase domain-containing protein [Planctomycetia bacterium]